LSGRGALSGIKILDLSSIIMGPFATQMLGDHGAEVIVVEPLQGGGSRELGPGRHPALSGIALNLLRNKRSLCIDLKNERGRDALLRVLATCDALVTNLRPAPLRRLGLTYQQVAAVAPQIVYCRAQGFPIDGDRADDPAYDDIIQSECGIADAGRRVAGTPSVVPTIVADKVCAFAIVQAILAAIIHRLRTGEGQHVEVPMIDVMRAFVLVEHGADAVANPRTGAAGYLRVLNPERGPQRTRDGWIHILPYSAAAYDALFSTGGRGDLVGDPRTRGRGLATHAQFLYGELRPIIATRTTAEWLEFCRLHQIPVGTVADLDEIVAQLPIVEHPEVGEYRAIPPPVRMSATPQQIWSPSPLLGADSHAVLRETGFTEPEIAELEIAGVIWDGSKDA
jgi:crotonobetainyl-CoA:carnitine CoA-transferase CaiB-like acyl-CoA transferase